MFDKIIEKDLNPSQQEGVLETSCPLLVLSGAGTGKTRVITYKIAYLIAQKAIPAQKILALTFTNKAAGEMKERALNLLKSKNLAPQINPFQFWMGTFHACCAKMLRIHAKHLGFTPYFSIVNEDDKIKIFKSIIEEKQLKHLAKIGKVQEEISRAKNNFLEPQDLLNLKSAQNSLYQEELALLYQTYQALLLKNNSMDFDDLITQQVKLLYQEEEVRAFWQNSFDYILVDEFQDTNKSQYLLLKMLMQPQGNNITLVGDDDQSIYSFRGATIGNILSLSKDLPSLKIVKVEENYRSAPEILRVANKIIAKNTHRLGKSLIAHQKPSSQLPIVFTATDDKEESQRVAKEIKNLIRENPQWSFGIIYRMNSQSRVFENALRTLNLPYKILGTKGFYDRREIKDLISYLRLIANPQDDLALDRIVNVPARGIGDVTLNKIKALALKENVSLLEGFKKALNHIKELKIRDKIACSIKDFLTLIAELQELITTQPAKILTLLIESLDFIKNLSSYGNEEERKANVEELERAYQAYFYEEEGADFYGFLHSLSLMDPVENPDDSIAEPQVFLSTVHGCKGLEFDGVFLVGLAQGVFPHHISIYTQEELEEERRLCYVAITRAKKRLFFSYPQQMFKHGNYEFFFKSQFIKDLEEGDVIIDEKPRGSFNNIEGLKIFD